MVEEGRQEQRRAEGLRATTWCRGNTPAVDPFGRGLGSDRRKAVADYCYAWWKQDARYQQAARETRDKASGAEKVASHANEISSRRVAKMVVVG